MKYFFILFNIVLVNFCFASGLKFVGIYQEYKRTLWNDHDGSDYTVDKKPFTPTMQLVFEGDTNVTYYSGPGIINYTYEVVSDTFCLIRRIGKMVTKEKFIIVENKEELVLREFKGNYDESFYLKKFFFKKVKKLNEQMLKYPGYSISASCNEKPDFEGGQTALNDFVKTELEKLAYKNGKRIRMELVLDPEGKIIEVTAVNNPKLDDVKVAVEIIRKMPNFKPGKFDGKPQYCKYLFNINLSTK